MLPHPWAPNASNARVLTAEEVKARFRPNGDTDPRIKNKVDGPKTRDKLTDPAKPEFERDEAFVKLLERVQKQRLDNIETKGREHRDTVTVKPFDVTQIKPDFTIVYFGKRREGKSYAMRWHLYALRDQLPRGYVFTATKINGFWQQYCPERYIFDGYSPAVLFWIIEQQKTLINFLRENPDIVINPNIFIVLDDCVTEDLFHDPVLNYLFFNGRHIRIFLLMSTQYARRLPPGMRENVDLAVIFRAHNISQREAIVDNFFGQYDKDAAIRCLEENVWRDGEDRQFLVVDNSGRSEIDDMVYAAHALDPDELNYGWVLGCKEWWGSDWKPEWDNKNGHVVGVARE